MPKESEQLNHKDNSNSKMIAIPSNSQVEEVLISDEEQQTEHDTQSYETKMYEKLRDLGLYEDGMTIQQMEELLAVVVASFETAEEEKSRRQFYQDYMTASEAFCNDQIEFTFKESSECSNQASMFNANFLDIPLPTDSANNTSYSKGSKSRPLTPNGDINPTLSITNDRTSDSSLEICENNCTKPSAEPHTSSEGKSKNRRTRSKRGRVSTANIKRVRSSRLFSKQVTLFQQKKELEGQSLSLWKPCLSPKDTPLHCSKRPWLNDPEPTRPETEEEYTKKIFNLVKDMDAARAANLQRFPLDKSLSKPYYLTRRVHFTKKSTKPDKLDVMVGVTTKKPSSTMTIDGKIIKESFSRTSGGAFRYVHANRTRTNFEPQTTRSGLKYSIHSTSTQNPSETKSKLANVKDSYRTIESAVTDGVILNSEVGAESPSHLFSEVEVILDEDLPKFNHLRPDIYGFSTVNDNSEQASDMPKLASSSATKNNSLGECSEKQNHVANSSCLDNDSSDGSLVIDVETVVDGEIEEFVLKRKLLQEYQCTEKEPNTSQSKRLKKAAL